MDRGEQDHDGKIVLGPQNPKDLGDTFLPLYESEGRVFSVSEFVGENLHLLGLRERDIVANVAERLFPELEIPGELNEPLTRSKEFSVGGFPACMVRRSGARSAYWEERRLKFKGCRPTLDESDFPLETLPFGESAIRYERVPFGVLRKEAVMREILARCFLETHGISSHSTPICVYEYIFNGRSHGCCLVFRTECETRLDEFIAYPDCSLGDVVAAHVARQTGVSDGFLGRELGLKGVNLWRYAEEKSKLLCQMHFHGGFRGILNSNIGNDVVALDDDAPLKLYLCDFDTFWMLDIPDAPSVDFLKHFALQCLIETVKGSISIFEYVDLPDVIDAAQRAKTLSEIYFQKSSVWRAYARRFYRNAKKRGWNPALVEKAVKEAVRTEAFADIVGGCVLNSRSMGELSRNRGIFYPHN